MSPEYPAPASRADFLASREHFDAAFASLGSENAASMAHSDIQARIEKDGRERMRRLLQDHLDLRATRETRLPKVLGSDGATRNHVRGSTRHLMPNHGEVQVPRLNARPHPRAGLSLGSGVVH